MEPTKKTLQDTDTIIINQLNSLRVSALAKVVAFKQWLIRYKQDPKKMILTDGGQYKSVATIVDNLRDAALETRNSLQIVTDLAKRADIDVGDYDETMAYLFADEALEIPRLVDENGNFVIDKKDLDDSINGAEPDKSTV